MARRMTHANLGKSKISRFFSLAWTQREEALPCFKLNDSGYLLHSADGGRSWRQAVQVQPGYKHLRLWRDGSETHLQLDYADRCVEMLSTDGVHWQAC